MVKTNNSSISPILKGHDDSRQFLDSWLLKQGFELIIGSKFQNGQCVNCRRAIYFTLTESEIFMRSF